MYIRVMSIAIASEQSKYASLWTLEPGTRYLNHGSYGACPRVVQAAQRELRDELECQPFRFFQRRLEPLLDRARAALAGVVGASADDLAFVTNATGGVNTVLRSLNLQPGDELLVTDHEYNACRNALEFVARRRGAVVRVVAVPFPLSDPGEVIQPILDAVTPKTRFMLIDHVTSPTGLVLPLDTIVPELRTRGVECIVDGAHAVGQVPLQLAQLGAAFYTSNAHKWLCAPKGSAFLYVRRDMQDMVQPLVISHGYNVTRSDRSHFRVMFDWTGTRDPTAWLVTPEVIAFYEGLPGGLPAVQAHNRALCQVGHGLLCEALGVERPAPASMMGSLATVVLPSNPDVRVEPPVMLDPDQERLMQEFNIEVPILPWPQPPQRVLRISAQLYNCVADYRALAAALKQMFGR